MAGAKSGAGRNLGANIKNRFYLSLWSFRHCALRRRVRAVPNTPSRAKTAVVGSGMVLGVGLATMVRVVKVGA